MPASPAALSAYVLADPLCRALSELARTHDRPMALVGGWVRDWLLGKPALDWDVVVPGDPTPLARDLAARLGGPVVTLDASFGVVRSRLDDGRMIDLVKQQGPTLADDLARRDLTINAMACELATGRLVDPHGGLADLAAGRVRALAHENLADDPLRLLRVYRFAATLGFTVDAETTAWVTGLAPRLAEPAGERVLAELAKLLVAPNVVPAVSALVETGLLAALFGAAPDPQAIERTARLSALQRGGLALMGPAGARTARLLDEPLAGDRPHWAVVQLAALGEHLAQAHLKKLGERLRLGAREAGWLRAATSSREAMRGAAADARALYRLQRTLGAAAFGVAARLAAEPGLAAEPLLASLWAFADHAASPRLLGGHDLQSELGLAPGPSLGRIMSALDEAAALGEVRSREEALAWAARLARAGE